MRDKGRRRREDSDLLNEWCAWKEQQPELTEEDFELVRAIRNVVIQVGSWRARHAKLKTDVVEYLKTRDLEVLKNLEMNFFVDPDPRQMELPLD